MRSEAWNYLGQTLSTRAPPAERSGEAVTISTQQATEGPEEMTVELRDTWLPDPGAIY